MKNLLVIKTMIIALCLGAVINPARAQNDADPAITSFSFAMSPIFLNHTTTLTVFFTNNGFTTSIASGSVGLNLSLPTSVEYGSTPASVAALSGTFLSKFNWSYNSTTKNYFGTNNQPILPGDGGTIIVTVKGFIEVTSRISVANIQRLNPGAYPNENINNNNLTAAAGVQGFTVPIKLLSFTASKQGKAVNLNWATANEINSSHFDVQYSKNGTQWQSIGIVAAAGNSNTQKNYSLVHAAPGAGVNYYRLKEVDIDAKFEYSLTRTVTFSTGHTINIMPNPTTDKLFINADAAGTLQSVTLYAPDGKQVMNLNNFTLGSSIDMRNYAPGTYLLKIVDKDGTAQTLKVMKQ